METAADITLNDLGGDILQYSIIPHDGSEPLTFFKHPNGDFEVMDQSSGNYSRVPGSEGEGIDLVDVPKFNDDNVYYDPAGGVSISVGRNADGLTEIKIYPSNQDIEISVVPEADIGTVSHDQRYDDPSSPGTSYVIKPPPGMM